MSAAGRDARARSGTAHSSNSPWSEAKPQPWFTPTAQSFTVPLTIVLVAPPIHKAPSSSKTLTLPL